MIPEAENRYVSAKQYQNVVKMIFLSPLNQSMSDKIATFMAMGMLAAFSLELFFKSWLLEAGTPSAEVKKYGHDLQGLYEKAVKLGFPGNIPNLPETVNLFAGPHKDFSYRYHESNDVFTIPNWINVFPVFDELNRVVDEFIGASASVGLLPGH
jgi:hypothetical protein